MADFKLGASGRRGVDATLNEIKNNGLPTREGEQAKPYEEVKAYIGTLRDNATLRVKHGSTAGELALGKETKTARLFKGDRSELTANTLASIVQKRFGQLAANTFLERLQTREGGFDVSRANVLGAFAEVEKLAGMDRLKGDFERRNLPSKTGADAVDTFVSHYPSRLEEGKGKALDGLALSGRFFGDIIERGNARFEHGILRVGRGLDGSTPEKNAEELKRFFAEGLGIDPEDKKKTQNAMNNLLNFFDQNCYITATAEAATAIGLTPGSSRIAFEGTVKLEGSELSIRRNITADVKEMVLVGSGMLDRETGWRYQAEDHFRLPLAETFVSNMDFRPEAMTDASRVESLERGQRAVSIDAES